MMMSVKEAGQNQTFEQNERLRELYGAISNGANSFLFSEYKLCTGFVVFLAGVIVGLVSWSSGRETAIFTATSFVVGALTSMLSGYIGMRVAVFSNARCTVGAAAAPRRARPRASGPHARVAPPLPQARSSRRRTAGQSRSTRPSALAE